MRKYLKLSLLCASSLVFLSDSALADTLQEALANAYKTNPTITGARAGQKATDETVTIAKSRGLPNANGSIGLTDNLFSSSGVPTRIGSIGADATIPIYTFGGVRSGINAAESRVGAGQANLRSVESNVFVQAVTAYMDVIRDEAIVGLNQAQIKRLAVNVEATKDRFQVGDLTRTDVAQSEARLALAQSNLQTAEARLIASREQYINIIGNEPGVLASPPPLPHLPENASQAVQTALNDSPALAAVTQLRKAAEFDVKSARSALMPRISGLVKTSYNNNFGSNPPLVVGGVAIPQSNSGHSVAAGVQATIPLFSGGANGAQVRQSQARLSQSMEQIIETERSIIANTRSSYAGWRSSLSVIDSTEVAIKASQLALEGVRAENSVGTRTILDILDAEQELLNNQVQLETAKRNAYVAGFQLLALMGHAQFNDLQLNSAQLYDPNVNYNRVKNAIWDWKTDPAPVTQATRTVDTAPQTPTISKK